MLAKERLNNVGWPVAGPSDEPIRASGAEGDECCAQE
jgi:hypothetical protein